MVYGIGNGQLMQLRLMPKIGALNCMHDQQAIILGGGTALNSNEEMKEGGDEMKDVSTTIVRRLTPL